MPQLPENRLPLTINGGVMAIYSTLNCKSKTSLATNEGVAVKLQSGSALSVW